MADQELAEADSLTIIAARQLNLDPLGIRLERCSTGKFNATWFVSGDGREWVLRVAPPEDRDRMLFYEHRMMQQEPSLHERIASATDVPIPTITSFDFSRRWIDRDYLIMERMPGTPISDHAGLTPKAYVHILRAVGNALRQVHAIHETRYGYLGPHAPMEPQSTWSEAFAIMWHALLDDIVRCDGYTREEAGMLRRLHDRYAPVFDRDVPASLLHMDVWAQNILADDDGRMTCLLDWDRALYGDPEIEFAVLDYCGISEPPFWEGHSGSRDRSREAEIRRVFYLLYEVQKYIVIQRRRHGNPRVADGYRKQSLELARTLQ